MTCGSSRDRAITAAEVGADYVAFGAVFPSTTKAAKHHADPELIHDWSEPTVVPCCAIGGITQENCGLNEVFARYGRAFADGFS